MKNHHHIPRRLAALLLAAAVMLSLVPSAFAAQEDNYHDPAEHWQTTNNRTNELDVNSVVTIETFTCCECGQATAFQVFRVPEYTRNGETALLRNVKYSDGTCLDGESQGDLMDGTPGVDAYYTGYHWTKAVCQTCGTFNTNMGADNYACGKNVYWLYDCAAEFMEALPESVTYEYADSRYHTKTTTGGAYCVFCFGTRHEAFSTLERHSLETDILPQPANGRFAQVEHCTLCDYQSYGYTTAKAVIADYYGVADGQPHTVTVSDLSDAGVSVSIRYGNSAEGCTLTSAPNYTEAGQYVVYYAITYTYGGESMTENGAAYVWLRDETTTEDGSCACGCGNPDCGCQDPDCDGCCCEDKGCGDHHNWVLLDSVDPTCLTLGYDRYLCIECGQIEKRDYEAALGHAFQSVVLREATCETDGKVLELCARCGQMQEQSTPKGEHEYATYSVSATCTSPSYTVWECSVCGERHIEDITSALAHNYAAKTIPAGCETGGKTIHACEGCGSSFVTDYTSPLGHSWDGGALVTNATCTGESVTEYRCVRCGYHRLEGGDASGHVPGEAATCTQPQLCTACGAVIEPALGHDYQEEVTAPTCEGMGHTTYTCSRCGDAYDGAYTVPTGHTPGDWIVDQEPTTDSEGSKHKECEVCGETLETEEIEKIYNQSTTDERGEAIVGGYLVTVSYTDTKNPVAGATVTLHADESLSIRLPSGRLLDYADQTTIRVQFVKDESPVVGMGIAVVTDRNGNSSSGKTDSAGQLTVPGGSDSTNEDGNGTVGWEDADGNRHTLTVKVEDYETKRPIPDAGIAIGSTGNITVTLPDGEDMDEANRITVTVTDHERQPQEGLSVIVKGDLGQTERGETDGAGQLTVPEVAELETHGAYVVGYTDGTFGPERGMRRSEAATIFARLLSLRLGEPISTPTTATFPDVPADAWYSGYVSYLTRYGVAVSYTDGLFHGDEPISRAEFTAMAVRFFDAYGDGDQEIMEDYQDFWDVSPGHWAAGYIEDAAQHGWVVGYGDGTFQPEDEISRAEVVTIVNRLLGREADQDYIARGPRGLVRFPDVSSGHWAYYDILEASNHHEADVSGDPEVWQEK